MRHKIETVKHERGHGDYAGSECLALVIDKVTCAPRKGGLDIASVRDFDNLDTVWENGRGVLVDPACFDKLVKDVYAPKKKQANEVGESSDVGEAKAAKRVGARRGRRVPKVQEGDE